MLFNLFVEAASTLKHVKLIPLAAAKSLEDLTKAFPVVRPVLFFLGRKFRESFFFQFLIDRIEQDEIPL